MDYPSMIPKSCCAIEKRLILLVMLALFAIDIDSLLHCGKALLQAGISEATLQPRAPIPLCKHIVGCAERGHPIDDGASTQSAASHHNQPQVFCSQRPLLQEEFRHGLGLLQSKIALVIVATLLQHDHTF